MSQSLDVVVSAEIDAPEGLHLLGRHAILDAQQNTFGYELLFGGSILSQLPRMSECGTEQVIDQILTFGLDTIVPSGKVFLKCTQEVLAEGLVTLLPAECMVLELGSDLKVDDALVGGCVQLKKLGYELALADYVAGSAMDGLVEFADYVKLNWRTCDAEQPGRTLKQLHGTKVAFIADRVETDAEFVRARDAGFEYFQGNFFARPTITKSREIPANKMLYIQLLGAVTSSPCDSRTIERLLLAEASLCLRLLRLVNSAGRGIRNNVRTIRQAMLMVGEDELRKVITTASVTALGNSLNRSSELILLGLSRARFCELLAASAGQRASEQYLIGLLSTLDAILLVPMEDLIRMLPLPSETKAVLLGEGGKASLPLRLLRAYEEKHWGLCGVLCRKLGMSLQEMSERYADSLRWAANQIRDCGW